MDCKSLLIYTIIALIVAITIHFLFVTFKLYSKENMTNICSDIYLFNNQNKNKLSCSSLSNSYDYTEKDNIYPLDFAMNDDNVNEINLYAGNNMIENDSVKGKEEIEHFNNDSVSEVGPVTPINAKLYSNTNSKNNRSEIIKYNQSASNHIQNKVGVNNFMNDGDNFLDKKVGKITPVNIVGTANKTPNLSTCISCDSENTWTKEFISPNTEICSPPSRKYSQKDLQNYRDSFFGFRDNTNQMGAEPDPVDRINLRYLEGDGDVTKTVDENIVFGEKISDVFDSIAGGPRNRDKGMKQYKETCVQSPEIQKTLTSPDYFMNGMTSSYYIPDEWVYKYDKMMNGGTFYNNVIAHKTSNDYPMMINY